MKYIKDYFVLQYNTMNLPTEIIEKIASYSDIDTRRALGIYGKMKVSPQLATEITKSFIKTEFDPFSIRSTKDHNFVTISIPYYDMSMIKFHKKMIVQDFDNTISGSQNQKIMRMISSWYMSKKPYNFDNGFQVFAGIPDDTQQIHVLFNDFKIQNRNSPVIYGTSLDSFDIMYD
jgi:hypothetical protein